MKLIYLHQYFKFPDETGGTRSYDLASSFVGKGIQHPEHAKIVFCKSVTNTEVAEYMSAVDVFALPTLNEGSSNVIVEAMASGLPIVSSDIPEIKVQCTNDFSILVNPRSVSEIAGALNKILENDELRNNMSMSAIEASKQFDITKRAERILKFINQIH